MSNPVTRRAGLALALATPFISARPLRAQGPTVRVVVPYAPGGTTDVCARLFAARASETLGQVWVVENRSGANGAIGSEAIARAPADGSALLYTNEVHLLLRYVQTGVAFDAIADFTPIIRTTSIPYVVVGGARHVREGDIRSLMEALRRSPARFSFASSGMGSVGHFGPEALARAAGVEVTIVTYRGTSPGVNDVIAGSVALMVAPLGAVLPMIQAGQLKAFSVTTAVRIAALPEVPTLAEVGYPEMVFDGWTGFWGPKGLPATKVDEAYAAVSQAIRNPEVRRRIADLGCAPIEEPQGAFAGLAVAEQARIGRIIRAVGIKPE